MNINEGGKDLESTLHMSRRRFHPINILNCLFLNAQGRLCEISTFQQKTTSLIALNVMLTTIMFFFSYVFIHETHKHFNKQIF